MPSRQTRHKRDAQRLKKRRLLHSVYIWHRSIGIITAAFVAWLAITGLLLNHTDRLELSNRTVSSAWLLNWYGINIHSVTGTEHFGIEQKAYSHSNQILINDAVINLGATINAADQTGDFWVVATAQSISLITSSGQLVETAATHLAESIRAINAATDNNIVLQTLSGSTYCGTIEFNTWRPCRAIVKNNQQNITLNRNQATQLVPHGIHFERVILDAHSGRLFGLWGTAIADITAILMLLLTITGTYTWIKRRKKKRR